MRALFGAAYGVTAGGNWEGTTILSRVAGRRPARVALRDARATVVAALASRARAILHERRDARPQPNRDDKVIAAWNGLALAAFADASWALDEPRYRIDRGGARQPRCQCSSWTTTGRLQRSWNRGTVRGAGTLEDHTHLADGYLALYQATFDERWFDRARELMALVEAHFVDPDGAGFLDTPDDGERLIARPRGLQDNAVPSGNAMAATVFLSLAAFSGEQRYVELARCAVLPLAGVAQRYPTAFAQVLQGIGAIARGIDEIAIVGDSERAPTRWRSSTQFARPSVRGACWRSPTTPTDRRYRCSTVALASTGARPPSSAARSSAASRSPTAIDLERELAAGAR